MKVQQLIDGLLNELHLVSLTPDEKGIYEIVFDDGLELQLLTIGGSHLLLRSRLTQLPQREEEQEAVILDYLRHNLAGLRDQTASLSLDRNEQCIWLAQTHRADRLTVLQLCDSLENFVNSLAWWQMFRTHREGKAAIRQDAFAFGATHLIRP
ncbi:MAG: CesT family type III secretion system chaperone [Planctomycetota bacterium]